MVRSAYRSIAVAITLCLAITSAASAKDPPKDEQPYVEGSVQLFVRTFKDVSPEDRASTRFRIPFLSIVRVRSARMGVPGLSAEVLGFGEVEAIEPLTGPRGRGDLLLANIAWRGLAKNALTIRAGRQLVFSGAANNAIMDGLYTSVRLPGSVELEAWGGYASEPEFDQSLGDWLTGARIAWNPWDYGHIGVSFAHERRFGEISREMLGIDLAWRQLRWLQVTGYTLLKTRDFGLAEASLRIDGRPGRDWQVGAGYRRFDPEARIPLTSIFSVFNHRHFDEVRLHAGWFPHRGPFSVHAEGALLVYDDEELGGHALIRPRLRLSRALGSVIGIEAGRVDNPDDGYWSVRAYGLVSPLEWMHLSADVEEAIHDTERNDQSLSTVARLTVGFDVIAGLTIMADGALTVNPTFEQHWAGTLRIAYDFSNRPRRRVLR